MINFSTKEYDLNTLFSFETLKEVLLELAKSQINIEQEIKNLKEENKNINLKYDDFQKEIENINDFKKDIYNKISMNKDEIIQNNNIQNNDIQNIENKNEDDENECENNNEIYLSNSSINKNNQKENIFDKELISNLKNNDINIEKKEDSKTLPNKTSDNLYINNNSRNNALLKKMNKHINELNSKIILLEKKYKSELERKKEEENQIKNKAIDDAVEFQQINDKINSLIQKNDDFEHKIESMESNLQGLDIFKMFKDDGSGTIDATKVMVKSLQEKVFKKFDLVETRYKKEIAQISKSTVENLVPKFDKINNDFKKVNELNNEQKEEFDNYIKNNEEKNKKLLNNLNNINNDFKKLMQKLKDEIYLEIKNSVSSLEEKLKNIINSSEKSPNQNTISLEKENNRIIDKKINDLRKKINDLENNLKLNSKKNENENIKKELKDIKTLLESKINSNHLKELYDYHLTDLDEINNIKDRLEINEEEICKINKDIRTAMQKIEIFEGNLIELQNSRGQPYKRMDFSRYIEQSKLNETISPILKNIEEILKEIESIRRDMNEIENTNKTHTKNSIINFEEENTNKLTELKAFVQKKYLEKYEFNRIIKNIEVQIKALNDENKKNNADTWLLAKKNAQCFNCASCETNIKKENYSVAEYLPWKKYPKGEKTHRMGQGFSHMLEMVSSEFAKNIEKNEIPNEDNNLNSESYINTSPEIIERASSTKLKINKKYLAQEEIIQNKRKKFGKMKLPKMSQSLKTYKNIIINNNHISDDENILDKNNINNENEKYEIHHTIEGSPKIIRIIKKVKNDLIANSTYNFKAIQEDKSRIDKDNDF